MDHTDFFAITERFPAEFAAANSFDEFAASLDGSKPGPGRWLQHVAAKYPGEWDKSFDTVKLHGFSAKRLEFPQARTIGDIFEHARIYEMQSGHYRGQTRYLCDGYVFVYGTRAPGFGWSGHVGARYDWSPDWLKRGEHVRRLSGGKWSAICAKPTAGLIDAFGPVNPKDEWGFSGIEVVRWEDGRHLIIGRTSNGFGSRWLTILPAGESARTLLDESDRVRIEREEAAQAAAWGEAATVN